MKNRIVSIALATVAGICFTGGLVILTSEGEFDMHRLDSLISMIDRSLDTKRKRHIAGGILLSASLLFGGIALTIMTIKSEDEENE